MPKNQPIRVTLLGATPRSANVYGPILKALPGEVKLVSVWGRREESASRLGQVLGVPFYTDLDALVRETQPTMAVVSVTHMANGQVGLMAVEHGLHVLLATPIAHKLSEADAIIECAARQRLKIEVDEQFHRRPLEQIKLKLIESGLFGRVYSSFNDFAGHGYHGVSVMRSYLGFDARPAQVTGSVHSYDLAPHWSKLDNSRGPRTETQEHGLIEYEDGRLGIFHWTDVGYDSALRWWRSSRFLAERGMGITVGRGLEVQEWLSLLAPGGEGPRFISVERRWERVDGGILEAMVAHTGDPQTPIVRWDNPLFTMQKKRNQQWHDDEIGIAGSIMSLVDAVRKDTEPTYGAQQARLDQEITLAIRMSAMQGGRPIRLPLDPAEQNV